MRRKRINRVLTFILVWLTVSPCLAVRLTIEPRSWANYGVTLKSKAEDNISRLLTQINAADKASTELSYGDVEITEDAAKSLTMLWDKLSHFNVPDEEQSQNCLRVGNNYQVRRIAVMMTTPDYKGNKERELIVNFDNTGRIVRVILQPEDITSTGFIPIGADKAATDKRLQILNYLESFRSFYEQKNWDALNTIYSENALIITGEVVRKTQNHIHEKDFWNKPTYIKYNVQTKQEYMRKLKYLFANARFINVTFSDIKVEQHPAKPQYFGVHLRQKWASANRQGGRYMDDGHLFLLWDFSNPDRPMIHVRKWTDIEDSVSVKDFKFE